MKHPEIDLALTIGAPPRLPRRAFLGRAGALGLGAAGALALGNLRTARAQQDSSAERIEEREQAADTVEEIFTAALIAEDLATVFYYNGLTGAVIQDPSLAGPGGSATGVTSSGNAGNVNYLQAALTEEIGHADLFRSLLNYKQPSQDPYQNFYFPAGTFDSLAPFLKTLNALENAFIGAYLNAIQEFAVMSAQRRRSDGGGDSGDAKHSPEQLDYFAKVAASILGVEAEHRVLGRVIGNNNPANNLGYEQTDGLNAVYNGPNSAVAALTPFLSSGSGPGYSLAAALENQGRVSLPVTGGPPAY